jgi:hypothetical protein
MMGIKAQTSTNEAQTTVNILSRKSEVGGGWGHAAVKHNCLRITYDYTICLCHVTKY